MKHMAMDSFKQWKLHYNSYFILILQVSNPYLVVRNRRKSITSSVAWWQGTLRSGIFTVFRQLLSPRSQPSIVWTMITLASRIWLTISKFWCYHPIIMTFCDVRMRNINLEFLDIINTINEFCCHCVAILILHCLWYSVTSYWGI